jgi:peptide/nickel transport system substrate-binding protein
MPTRRTARRLALLAGLCVPLVAGTNFRYAEDRGPALVDPLFTTSMGEARLHELVFESLYTDDQNLAPAPLLAESATPGDGGRSLLVTLRSDVEWHDGKPLVAADVVFTVNALKDPGTVSPEAGRVAFIERAEAVGDRQVRFTFVQPEQRPEEKLYFKILPAHRFQGTAVQRNDPFHTRPVGTGPYQVSRFQPDNSVLLTASPQDARQPGIPEVVMREVSDKNYQAKLLLYESLEALVRVLPRDLAILQNSDGVELYPYQTNSWWYVGFNLQRAPYDDVRVRKALSLLVDAQGLLDPVGTGERVSGPYVPSSPYYNHDVRPRDQDPAAARALLEDAGFTQSDGAWTTPQGEPLAVRLAAPRGLESAQEVVINLQSQLVGQGVQVQVEFLDEAAWKGRIWRQHDFDLVLGQWSFDRSEDIREQFHSTGTRNFGSYASEDVDRLLDEARDSRDPTEKKARLREVHRRVHEDTPMIFLWTMDSYSAIDTGVRNVTIHPFYYFTWVRDWRLE